MSCHLRAYTDMCVQCTYTTCLVTLGHTLIRVYNVHIYHMSCHLRACTDIRVYNVHIYHMSCHLRACTDIRVYNVHIYHMSCHLRAYTDIRVYNVHMYIYTTCLVTLGYTLIRVYNVHISKLYIQRSVEYKLFYLIIQWNLSKLKIFGTSFFVQNSVRIMVFNTISTIF